LWESSLAAEILEQEDRAVHHRYANILEKEGGEG